MYVYIYVHIYICIYRYIAEYPMLSNILHFVARFRIFLLVYSLTLIFLNVVRNSHFFMYLCFYLRIYLCFYYNNKRQPFIVSKHLIYKMNIHM